MADGSEITTSSAATQAASVTAAPVAEPQAASSPAPVVTPTPATPEVSTTPTEVKVEAATVLGDAPPTEQAPVTDPAKPADGKPEEDPAKVEQPKEESPQSEQPAPELSYEDFTVPDDLGETFKLDTEKLGEFTKELSEFETVTKASREEVKKFGQNLINRHIAEVQNTVNRLNEYYVNTWEKQKADWKDAFEKDPEIGGNRAETTAKAAREFITKHGGTDAQRQEFFDLMNKTGIGNHPSLIRILANANLALAEGRPIPAQRPAFQPKSKIAKRYGNSE